MSCSMLFLLFLLSVDLVQGQGDHKKGWDKVKEAVTQTIDMGKPGLQFSLSGRNLADLEKEKKKAHRTWDACREKNFASIINQEQDPAVFESESDFDAIVTCLTETHDALHVSSVDTANYPSMCHSIVHKAQEAVKACTPATNLNTMYDAQSKGSEFSRDQCSLPLISLLRGIDRCMSHPEEKQRQKQAAILDLLCIDGGAADVYATYHSHPDKKPCTMKEYADREIRVETAFKNMEQLRTLFGVDSYGAVDYYGEDDEDEKADDDGAADAAGDDEAAGDAAAAGGEDIKTRVTTAVDTVGARIPNKEKKLGPDLKKNPRTYLINLIVDNLEHRTISEARPLLKQHLLTKNEDGIFVLRNNWRSIFNIKIMKVLSQLHTKKKHSETRQRLEQEFIQLKAELEKAKHVLDMSIPGEVAINRATLYLPIIAGSSFDDHIEEAKLYHTVQKWQDYSAKSRVASRLRLHKYKFRTHTTDKWDDFEPEEGEMEGGENV